jgi:hypothetical protein
LLASAQGVAQHDRLDAVGLRHIVLKRDEPAVGAARDGDLVGADPLAQVSTSARWACEYGGMPSLWPQPRA